MVEKSIIDYIIGKCLSLSSMRSRLNGMSHAEKLNALDGRLTQLELEDYNRIYKESYQDYVDKWMQRISDGVIDKDKIPKVYEFIKKLETDVNEDLFRYERRILEGYTVSDTTPPSINYDDYFVDESVPFTETNALDRNTIKNIEKEMIDYQETHYNLTNKEEYWIEAYYLDNYTPLKYRINHDYDMLTEHIYDELELAEFNYEFPNMLRHMDNAINKQDGLLHPTLLFHGGPVDISVPVGGHGVWKNYISTSFQEDAMKGHNKTNPDYWETLIYAPKGTKGLCGNVRHNYGRNSDGSIKWDGDGMGMNQYTFEHEYLLGRGTGYTVISLDYVNHRQIVVLDEP